MKKSALSAITKAGGSKLHVLWAKIYMVGPNPPKDFAQKFPTLEPLKNLIDFPGIDTADIKKACKQSNSPAELETKLVQLFNLDYNPTIEVGIINIIHKIQFPKYSEQAFTYFYFFCLRRIIRNLYLFDSSYEKLVENDSLLEHIDAIYTLCPLVAVLLLGQDKNYDLFEEVVPYLLDKLDSIWKPTFSNPKMKKTQAWLLEILTDLTRLLQMERMNGYDSTYNFVFNHFSSVLTDIPEDNFDETFVIPFRNVLAGLTTIYRLLSDQNKFEISTMATNILQIIVKFKNIQKKDVAAIGKQTLGLYAECSKALSADISINQFQVIINFVIWLIQSSSENHAPHKVVLPSKSKTLQPISTNYFNYVQMIPERQCASPASLQITASCLSDICQRSQHEKDLMAILAKSISENLQDFTSEQMQQFIGFVIDVIYKAKDQMIFDVFHSNWEYLLNERIFSLTGDSVVQNAISHLIVRLFNSSAELRSSILKALSVFISKDPENHILYFMPMFVTLFSMNDQNNFIEEFSTSPILEIFIQQAPENYDIYDFIRRISIKDPHSCFSVNKYTTFIFSSISEEDFKESAIYCIKIGMLSAKLSNTNEKTLISIFIFIIHTLNAFRKTNTKLGIIFIKLLREIYSEIPLNIFDDLFQLQIFEVIAEYCIFMMDEEMIHEMFKLFTEVSRLSLKILAKFTNQNFAIYKIIENALKNITFSISDDLYEFTCGGTQKGQPIVFRNPRALELLLLWSVNKPDEKEILSKLFQQCVVSFTSMDILTKVNTTAHLIKRLGNFNQSNDLSFAISDIISQLFRNTFTNSDLNEVISLIKDPSYKNPHMFLEVFYDFLKYPQIPFPNAYFHFNGLKSGIESIDLPLPDTFNVKFSARFDLNIMRSTLTFLTIKFKTETIKIDITSTQKIVITRKTQSNNFQFEPILTLNQGIWTDFTFAFGQNHMSITHYNKTQTFNIHPNQIRGLTNATIKIGDINSSFSQLGLPCEVSVIKFCDSEKIYASFDPLHVFRDKLADVYQGAPPITFSGEVYPYVIGIQTVVPTISALTNFIPLLSRLNDERIPFKEGSLLLKKFFNILTWCFTKRELLQEEFAKENLVQVLAGYIMNLDKSYLGSDTIKYLADIFNVITNSQMIISFIQDILFNFELLKKFESIIVLYFSNLLPKIFVDNQPKFEYFKDYETLIVGFIENDDKKIRDVIWKFIFSFFQSLKPKNITMKLITLASLQVDDFIKENLLSLTKSLVYSTDESDLKELETYDYILPFLDTIDSRYSKDCIIRLSKFLTTEQQEKLAFIMIYKLEDTNIISSCYEFIRKIIFVDEHKTNFAMMPFISKAMKYWSESEKSYIQNNFISIISNSPSIFPSFIENPLPLYWLSNIMLQCINIETDTIKFVVPFSLILTNMKKGQFPISNFLSFCITMQKETGRNFLCLYKRVIRDIIVKFSAKEDIVLSKEDLLWSFFVACFYDITFVQDKTKSDEDLTNDYVQLHLNSKITKANDIKSLGNIISGFDSSIIVKFRPTINPDHLDVMEMFLALIDEFTDTKISFDSKFRLSSCHVFSYIIVTFLRYGKMFNFESDVEKLTKILDKEDQIVSHCCSSIIIKEAKRNKLDIFNLEIYPLAFNDHDDSPELQMFLFEDKLCRICSSLSNQISLKSTEVSVDLRLKIIERIKGKQQETKRKVVIEQSPTKRQIRTQTTKRKTYQIDEKDLQLSLNEYYQSKKKNTFIEHKSPKSEVKSDIKETKSDIRKSKSDIKFSPEDFNSNEIKSDTRKTKSDNNLPKSDNNLQKSDTGEVPSDHDSENEFSEIDSLFVKLKEYGEETEQNALNNLRKLRANREETMRNYKKMIEKSAGPWSTNKDTEQNQLYLLNRTTKDGQRNCLVYKSKNTKKFDFVFDKNNVTYKCEATFVRVLDKFVGNLYLYDQQKLIVFYGNCEETEESKLLKIKYSDIDFIFYHDGGIVIITRQGSHYLLKISPSIRKEFLRNINYKSDDKKYEKFNFFAKCRKICSKIYQSKSGSEIYNEMKLQKRWMEKRITTFEYIIYMNYLSGRSFADVENYPVFPQPLKFHDIRGHSYNRQPSPAKIDAKNVLNQLRNVEPYREAFKRIQEGELVVCSNDSSEEFSPENFVTMIPSDIMNDDDDSFDQLRSNPFNDDENFQNSIKMITSPDKFLENEIPQTNDSGQNNEKTNDVSQNNEKTNDVSQNNEKTNDISQNNEKTNDDSQNNGNQNVKINVIPQINEKQNESGKDNEKSNERINESAQDNEKQNEIAENSNENDGSQNEKSSNEISKNEEKSKENCQNEISSNNENFNEKVTELTSNDESKEISKELIQTLDKFNEKLNQVSEINEKVTEFTKTDEKLSENTQINERFSTPSSLDNYSSLDNQENKVNENSEFSNSEKMFSSNETDLFNLESENSITISSNSSSKSPGISPSRTQGEEIEITNFRVFQSLPRTDFCEKESPTRRSTFIGSTTTSITDFSGIPQFDQESALVPEVFCVSTLTNGLGTNIKWACDGEQLMISMMSALEAFQFTTQAHKWFSAAFPTVLKQEHPQRVTNPDIETVTVPSHPLDTKPFKILRGFCFCGHLIKDIMNHTSQIDIKLPPSFNRYSLIDGHHSTSKVVISNLFGKQIDVFSLRKEPQQSINFGQITDGALVTCLSVCGSNYLVVGSTDCSIYVFSLKTTEFLQKTSFHTRQIVCLASCSASKLVMSTDICGNCVVESVAKKSFLCSFSLSSFNTFSKLYLFPSGYFVVVSVDEDQKQVCIRSSTIFNAKTFRKKYAEGNLTCCRKVKVDGIDKIVIGFENGVIKSYLVQNLTLSLTLNTHINTPTFCSAGNTGKIILCGSNNTLYLQSV
ncbi:hypothetical protein TVAG_409840 [Trichomonas vaginalis G3]|uniref:BEACH domain-containing protein n=1 Tax=Trichomonas vaginalis (strain ATCC PRA-98 / G3) TaxID=412133 RepID=A2F8E4_TRIV3|nr:BEACH domain-containing protein family [Trichomonas vaginalis G3]EAX98846.1 hypothetical protein TVAG_409840 [Trichomonas vaginalis G3]KAI5532232.1 BEACH domain-containing protein family [Trichomonas vaginalis G3]|eukprot:XP_001311776.1 hypothetical protein [Trichomonas vaginalis G3]